MDPRATSKDDSRRYRNEEWGGAARDSETNLCCVCVRWLLLAPAAPTATTVLSTLHRSSNTDTEKGREGKAHVAAEGKICPMIGKSAHAAGGGEQASFFAQPLCKLLGSWVGGWETRCASCKWETRCWYRCHREGTGRIEKGITGRQMDRTEECEWNQQRQSTQNV